MLFRYSGLFFQTEKRGSSTQVRKTAVVMASVFFLFCVFVNTSAARERPVPGPMSVQPAAIVAPPIILTAPTTTKPAGVPFTIPINVSDTTGDGIQLFQFTVTYDPAVIDPVGANNGCSTAGTLSAAFTVVCNVSTAGTLEVTGLSGTPLTGAGVLINLNFQSDPLAPSGSVSALTFSAVAFNGGAVAAGAPVNGQVTITGTTAGEASVSGRVTTHAGNPIGGARVSLLDANGNVSVTLTNPFGYFRFDDVEAGETYIVSVRSKRYSFQPRVINVGEEITELNFVAEQ